MSDYLSGSVSRRGRLFGVVFSAVLICSQSAVAKEFSFLNVTDLPGGPGQGNAPSINDQGDIAFYSDDSVFFFDNSEMSFLDITALPGAPTAARFPKLNSLGNIAMVDPTTRDLWLFEAATQAFTNVSALPSYPGNSEAHSLRDVFDLNDNNKISLHSGGLNTGTVYVYDQATGAFTEITGSGGGPTRGRENVINNADQVGFAGFPSLYVYDPASDVATNISGMPAGPGGVPGSFALNDLGDAAIFYSDDTVYYDASADSFLSLSTLAGWPAGAASSNANDLSNNGEITFWRDAIYYFDPLDQSFTQLTDIPGVTPVGGLESSINNFGQVAFTAGLLSIEDIFLADPLPDVPLAGDGNLDGTVDGLDYLIWAANFGDNPADDPPGSPQNGDYNDDGVVDGFDYLEWAANFSGVASSSGTVAVPEPSTLALALCGLVGLFGRRR